MSSEFINDSDDVDPVTKSCDDSIWMNNIAYVIVIIVILFMMAYFMNYYGNMDLGCFQGAFPERSDYGADKFNLQKEVEYLSEQQMNNIGLT